MSSDPPVPKDRAPVTDNPRECDYLPTARLETLQAKMRDMELRIKLIEGELRGQVDLSQFLAKPGELPGAGMDDEP